MKLSVSDSFSGKTVLLTGSLGGVGSACLEQLLRLADIESVLLLAQPGHTQCAR
jgi:FlaA1/EpsC-like NDP-sugar epimerase